MISIIIPVYKAEKYIHRCLDSVLNQTYIDWECILIDDGSPDKSGVICDEYASKDHRFKSIHKCNGGVSSARNLGLENACGDRITFLDADDSWERDFLSVLASSNADVVTCSFRYKENKKFVLKSECFNKKEYYSEIQKLLFNGIMGVPWGKLYNTSLIKQNNILFNSSLRLGEDTCFNWNLMSCINSIEIIEDCLYVYNGDPWDHSKYNLSWDEIVVLERELINSLKKLERVTGNVIYRKFSLLGRLASSENFISEHTDLEVYNLYKEIFPESTLSECIRYCITSIYLVFLSDFWHNRGDSNNLSITFITFSPKEYLKAGLLPLTSSSAIRLLSKKHTFLSYPLILFSLFINSVTIRIHKYK